MADEQNTRTVLDKLFKSVVESANKALKKVELPTVPVEAGVNPMIVKLGAVAAGVFVISLLFGKKRKRYVRRNTW